MEACAKIGHPYAGVENGDECYCDNERPPADRKAEDPGICSMPCPGLNKKDKKAAKCGGPYALDVYETGVKAMKFRKESNVTEGKK